MTETKTSPRELYLLGMISVQRTYGHELVKAIKISRADKWVSLSDKHVYYVLRKLASEGLLTESEEREGNTPPRKVYEITPAGRERLREMLQAPDLREAFLPAPFDAVIGMLAFTEVLGREASLGILRARREVLAKRLEEDHPEGFGDLVEGLYGFLARALYEKARALLESELAWLDDVIARAEGSPWESLRVPRDFLGKEDA